MINIHEKQSVAILQHNIGPNIVCVIYRQPLHVWNRVGLRCQAQEAAWCGIEVAIHQIEQMEQMDQMKYRFAVMSILHLFLLLSPTEEIYHYLQCRQFNNSPEKQMDQNTLACWRTQRLHSIFKMPVILSFYKSASLKLI